MKSQNISQILLASSVSLAKPVALSVSTVQKCHYICEMMFVQTLAASEYQIRYFNKVGVMEAAASKAKAAIHAYRTLRNNKDLCETLCNETTHVCQPRKDVSGAVKNDRKEAAV